MREKRQRKPNRHYQEDSSPNYQKNDRDKKKGKDKDTKEKDKMKEKEKDKERDTPKNKKIKKDKKKQTTNSNKEDSQKQQDKVLNPEKQAENQVNADDQGQKKNQSRIQVADQNKKNKQKQINNQSSSYQIQVQNQGKQKQKNQSLNSANIHINTRPPTNNYLSVPSQPKKSSQPSKRSNKKQRQNSPPKNSHSKLQNLAELNQNYRQIKQIHEQNTSKLNHYKSQYEQLQIKVKQNEDNIRRKAKQLKDLSKKIYKDSLNNNKQFFYNQTTFVNLQQFQKFIDNLRQFVEVAGTCPYEDPVQNLDIVSIIPQILIEHCIGQHKKQRIIHEYLTNFPYITIGYQFIPLIRALIKSTKYIEQNNNTNSSNSTNNNNNNTALIQFPCLFTRRSSLPYPIFQQTHQILYRMITSDPKIVLKDILQTIDQCYGNSSTLPFQQVYQLIMKGLNKIRYVSLPEVLFELRGFCYAGYIYINTYYIDREQGYKYRKDIKVGYCVMVALREISNFVINSLTYAVNKSDQDISKNIAKYRERTDPGTVFERYLTNGKQFMNVGNGDYRILSGFLHENFGRLGQYQCEEEGNGGGNQNIGGSEQTSFMFQQLKQKKFKLISELLNKYQTKPSVVSNKSSQISRHDQHYHQTQQNKNSHQNISLNPNKILHSNLEPNLPDPQPQPDPHPQQLHPDPEPQPDLQQKPLLPHPKPNFPHLAHHAHLAHLVQPNPQHQPSPQPSQHQCHQNQNQQLQKQIPMQVEMSQQFREKLNSNEQKEKSGHENGNNMENANGNVDGTANGNPNNHNANNHNDEKMQNQQEQIEAILTMLKKNSNDYRLQFQGTF